MTRGLILCALYAVFFIAFWGVLLPNMLGLT